MMYLNQGRDINGWLVVDKPSGCTSTMIVNLIKCLTKARKVGHSGTLDPLATGVLPIALGRATKCVQYIMSSLKCYRFTVQWGEARDTDDSDGKIIALSDERPSVQSIETTLPRFIGTIEQMPPRFSAVKLYGRRACDIARFEKIELALLPRQVYVHSFTLLAVSDTTDHALFEVYSGKGVYIRALARDLACALGTVGHVVQLRRTVCGSFLSELAITAENLKEIKLSMLLGKILPVEAAFENLPCLRISEEEAYYLNTGKSVELTSQQAIYVDALSPVPFAMGGIIRAVVDDSKVVALARVEHGVLKPVYVFNLL